MNKLQIAINYDNASSSYPIFIADGLLSSFSDLFPLDSYSKVVICFDQAVGGSWLDPLLRGIKRPAEQIKLIASEEQKTLQQAEKIWQQLLDYQCDRRSLVLNLGGGIIGDLAGFAASTYMRGLDFVQIPTTLLAQVDASVGGKLAVNFSGLKNLVGCFNQPRAVVIDVDTLSTLPKREISAGFAEVVKHSLIADQAYAVELKDLNLASISKEQWIAIITRSCEIKAKIVEADEREASIRKVLNFGHTVGHAVESLLLEKNEHLLHGEAVALGMIVESHIALQKGLISQPEYSDITALLAAFDLPLRLPAPISVEQLIDRILFDKKNVAGQINWTLIKGIGSACFDQEASTEQVRLALAEIM